MSSVRLDTLAMGHYRVIGDLTFETANQAYSLARQIFQDNTDVLIDVGEVKRIDSAGIACLLEWIREGRMHESEVLFENIQQQLTMLIRVSGLERLIKVAA
ncbi:MAG: STAS domain-containing protein [Gammaproteobacteria bacterium]|nr:STAS domain-containing protein [Gammaproteobacteria bacterium]